MAGLSLGGLHTTTCSGLLGKMNHACSVKAKVLIIQQRLKRPGAWWSPAHVEAMLALRLNRANREWEAYWQRAQKEAAGTGQPVVASL